MEISIFAEAACDSIFLSKFSQYFFTNLWCIPQLLQFLIWSLFHLFSNLSMNSLFAKFVCYIWHNTSLLLTHTHFPSLLPASTGDPWRREDADQRRAGGGRRPGGGERRRQDPCWPPYHLLPWLQGGPQTHKLHSVTVKLALSSWDTKWLKLKGCTLMCWK